MTISHADTAIIREEAARVGESIYERRLKSLLEPACHGQIVAIHLPSQEYFLGHSLLEAADRLREKYPDAVRGEIYARGVGERASDPRAHAAGDQNIRVKGRLTSDYTAYVELEVLEAGDTHELVVDTGFNDYLYLPEDTIATWGLPFVVSATVSLADGSTIIAYLYEANIVWFGATVRVSVPAGPSAAILSLG